MATKASGTAPSWCTTELGRRAWALGVDVAAPVAGNLSLTVDHLSSGNRMEDRELQRRIDSRRYPKIEGTLDKIAPSEESESYLVGGDMAGKSTFDIREFGMEPPRILLLKVEPDVEIRVEIFATKEPEE